MAERGAYGRRAAAKGGSGRTLTDRKKTSLAGCRSQEYHNTFLGAIAAKKNYVTSAEILPTGKYHVTKGNVEARWNTSPRSHAGKNSESPAPGSCTREEGVTGVHVVYDRGSLEAHDVYRASRF